jgi:hypothetical protein
VLEWIHYFTVCIFITWCCFLYKNISKEANGERGKKWGREREKKGEREREKGGRKRETNRNQMMKEKKGGVGEREDNLLREEEWKKCLIFHSIPLCFYPFLSFFPQQRVGSFFSPSFLALLFNHLSQRKEKEKREKKGEVWKEERKATSQGIWGCHTASVLEIFAHPLHTRAVAHRSRGGTYKNADSGGEFISARKLATEKIHIVFCVVCCMCCMCCMYVLCVACVVCVQNSTSIQRWKKKINGKEKQERDKKKRNERRE